MSYLVGLVFLLLLAPCKVRNYIQAELGLPTTEVSNKSITNSTKSDCKTLEVTKNTLTFSKSSSQAASLLVVNTISFPFILIDFNKKATVLNTKEINSISLVPLYILFKNFKVYI